MSCFTRSLKALPGSFCEALERSLESWRGRLDLASATHSAHERCRREATHTTQGTHTEVSEEARLGVEAALASELQGPGDEVGLVAVGEDGLAALPLIERTSVRPSCWEVGCSCLPREAQDL